MAETEPDLSLVRRLKAKGRYDEALRQLEAWLTADPDNPILLYEMASGLDNQSLEDQAIPYYRRALDAGLDRVHRVDCLVGLGSSLRVMGRVQESHAVLKQGVKEYPHHLALKVFYALTLEKMGNYGDAIFELLDVIAKPDQKDSLNVYQRAILYYRDHRHDFVRIDIQAEDPDPEE